MSDLLKDADPDPDLFRQMSKPFVSMDAANEAMRAFFQGVKELREQHGIATVYVIVHDSVRHDGDKPPQDVMTSAMWGDWLRGEMLTAWALGQEQAVRQERIADVMKQAFERGPRGR